MQEVKRPKKPLIYFYAAMILAILVSQLQKTTI